MKNNNMQHRFKNPFFYHDSLSSSSEPEPYDNIPAFDADDDSGSMRLLLRPAADFDDSLEMVEKIIKPETESNVTHNKCAKASPTDGQIQSRGKRRAASGAWSCVVCSFENAWLNTTCEMCLSARPTTRTEVDTSVSRAPIKRQKQPMVANHKKRSKQDEKHHAMLKVLARLAAASVQRIHEGP